MRQRKERKKDDEHLKHVRSLPCVICLDDTTTEAAHVSYAEPKVDKIGRGIGGKESDIFTVPLCGAHHRMQHDKNEQHFWTWFGIDPIRLAMALYINTGDHAAGTRIVKANRPTREPMTEHERCGGRNTRGGA